MPQYRYPVKKGVKWLCKFSYIDPKTGDSKTEYKRGFDSKRDAKTYEEDFLERIAAESEEYEEELVRTFGSVFEEYLASHKHEDIKCSSLDTKFGIFNKHIFPTFEDRPIDEITDDDIGGDPFCFGSKIRCVGTKNKIKSCGLCDRADWFF